MVAVWCMRKPLRDHAKIYCVLSMNQSVELSEELSLGDGCSEPVCTMISA